VKAVGDLLTLHLNRTLCEITLSAGTGSCKLTSSQLKAERFPGYNFYVQQVYYLAATYEGSTASKPSTSSPQQTLTIK
jgi:predicted dienelactone hydrolase